MNRNSSVPVSAYSTEIYQSSYNQFLNSGTLNTGSLTIFSTENYDLTIVEGEVDGIKTDKITDPSDAINKEYLLKSKKPSGPSDSIQFNDKGVFGGSDKLLFSGNYNEGSIVTSDIRLSDHVIEIGNEQITGLPYPLFDSQIANKAYTDKLSNTTNIVRVISPSGTVYSSIAGTIIRRSTPLGISSVVDTVPSAQDIIYDLVVGNIQVRAATVSNITLSGLQTIDGYTLSSGNYVLVKNQTLYEENGVYTVPIGGGTWTRVPEPRSGYRVYVLNGTVNRYKLFLNFKEISPLRIGTYYEFTIINESTHSTVNISEGSGTTLSHGSTGPVVLFPTYIATGIVCVTSLYPPGIELKVNSIRQGVKYLGPNFTPSTFRTNLAYAVTDSFLIPGPSEPVLNTESEYTYTEEDVLKNIVIRNPGSDTSDGFDNLLLETSFTIQNISAFTITISGTNSSGSWILDPSPIVIGPSKSQTIILGENSSINYATGLGQVDF
jgi:hypothetical protein